MTCFSSYPLAHGPLDDFAADEFPTRLSAWMDQPLELEQPGTHFGFAYSGEPILRCASGMFSLLPGMYFAVPGRMLVERGSGVVISRLNRRGFFHVGGPIEDQGRLRYIDGCTDSLLIPPVTRGDPCLNLLHLPPHTRQTAHTHPSLRTGMVIRGAGECVTPDARFPLAPGQVFAIRANGRHSFHTADSELVVLAYHPDSDFGPTDEVHPMINQTILARK